MLRPSGNVSAFGRPGAEAGAAPLVAPSGAKAFGKGYAPAGAPGGFAVAPWTPSHPFSCLFSMKQEKKVTFLPRHLTTMPNETGSGRRFPKGDRKALWSRPQARNPSGKGMRLRAHQVALRSPPGPLRCISFVRCWEKYQRKVTLLPRHQNLCPTSGPRRFPKGDRKALWPPPQRRNPCRGPKLHAERIPLHTKRAPAIPDGRSLKADYSMTLATTPEPTVRPPSRMAKRRPCSMAMGVIRVISMSMLSPGMTISTPSGSLMLPVTSVVRK